MERKSRLHLCEYWPYCACKNADSFEAMTKAVCGSCGKTLELYRRGAVRWPDERNFRAGVIRTQVKAQTVIVGAAMCVKGGFSR